MWESVFAHCLHTLQRIFLHPCLCSLGFCLLESTFPISWSNKKFSHSEFTCHLFQEAKHNSRYNMETVSVSFAAVTSNPPISMPYSTSTCSLFTLPEGYSPIRGQFYVSVRSVLFHCFLILEPQGGGAALVDQAHTTWHVSCFHVVEKRNV